MNNIIVKWGAGVGGVSQILTLANSKKIQQNERIVMGNITITHTFMFHICTFNVKISKNQLLLLAYFYGQNSND